MFKRILMALKFAPAAEFALVKGIELARVHAAELHILHVLDYVLKDLDEDDPQLVDAVANTKQQYNSKIRPLLSDLENVTFRYIPADPALEVCKMARSISADLIILGCHQLPEKMCLGRVDYVGITILEKAPCPVLLVPLCE
jgi:nucleotide-binding universal stress UspA family protein